MLMNKYFKDVMGGVAFVVLFGAFFAMGTGFPEEVRTYPWVICGIGMLFSGILLIRSVAALQRHRGEEDTGAHMSHSQMASIGLTLAATTAYVALTGVVGYFVMTFLFVTGFSYYLDPRQKKIFYILVGLIMDVVLYFAFDQFLNVNLPRGFLF